MQYAFIGKMYFKKFLRNLPHAEYFIGSNGSTLMLSIHAADFILPFYSNWPCQIYNYR